MSQSRLIGTIALVTWLLVAAPVLLYHVPDGSLGWRWSAVYSASRAPGSRSICAARTSLLPSRRASAAALYLVLLLRRNGYEGRCLRQ